MTRVQVDRIDPVVQGGEDLTRPRPGGARPEDDVGIEQWLNPRPVPEPKAMDMADHESLRRGKEAVDGALPDSRGRELATLAGTCAGREAKDVTVGSDIRRSPVLCQGNAATGRVSVQGAEDSDV